MAPIFTAGLTHVDGPLVDRAIAVVVLPITNLDAIVAWRAGIFASVFGIAIEVDVARQAGEPALALLAESAGVGKRAHSAARAAVGSVGLQVEAFVDLTVAVVVLAVADLHPAVAQSAFAAVSRLGVEIHVAGIAGAHCATARDAGGLGGKRTDGPALAAVVCVSLEIDPGAQPAIKQGPAIRAHAAI